MPTPSRIVDLRTPVSPTRPTTSPLPAIDARNVLPASVTMRTTAINPPSPADDDQLPPSWMRVRFEQSTPDDDDKNQNNESFAAEAARLVAEARASTTVGQENAAAARRQREEAKTAATRRQQEEAEQKRR